MVNAFIIVVAALAASVTARPISGRAKGNDGDVSLGDLADLIVRFPITQPLFAHFVFRAQPPPPPLPPTQQQELMTTQFPQASPTSYAPHTDQDSEEYSFALQGGVIIPAGNNDAHDEQQAEFSSAAIAAAAAETAAGIDIAASIAAASSSAAAAAATASVNPLDPLPAQNTNLTPEQLGQLSGLRAKLQIDNQFGDTGAAIDDQEAINALIEDGEGSFGF
jgi:hypothetical protein